MENRFTIKDLVLFTLVIGVIVLVGLAMVQYDRQWGVLQTLSEQSREQTRELSQIRRMLQRGVLTAAVPTTGPAGQDDPFERIRTAQTRDDYAMGDWFIDAGPNIAKLTPLVSTDVYASDIQVRILETLAARDPVTLKFEPHLAKSWQISEDGMTMTFQLREGVTFSDGEPFTADDVVYSFELIMNPKIEAPRARAYYQKIKSVKKTGNHEVVFTFAEPYFQSFTLAGGMEILPKHFMSKFTPEEINRRPGLLMGTGPYRLEDPSNWAPGKPLQLLRNDRYWGEPPAFNRLIYREIDNDLAKLTSFRNGDIDGMFRMQPEPFRELLKDPGTREKTQHYDYPTPLAGYRYIGWNQRRSGKPTRFADKRVRLAMTLLTDRERINNEILFGYGRTISGPFVGNSPQADKSIEPWPYDPARAKRLLAEAGYTDRNGDGVLESEAGEKFAFNLIYPSGISNYEQMALFLKDSYARAGIALTPDPLDWSVFSERLKNREFDVITLGWGSSIEGDLYQMFHSDQIEDGGDNTIGYTNPELDKVIEAARRTVDESKRMKLWQEAHRILHGDQPYTFLMTRNELAFLSGRVKNVQVLPLGLNDLVEWYVPKGSQKWEK